jgi:thioesterase domain-containing protein/acyl carrier protein
MDTSAFEVRVEPPTPAATPTQKALTEIWRQLLDVQQIGIRDSFFDIGGDSLKAVEVFLAIERRFGQDLPLSLLAESPTIESLAAIIDAGGEHEFSGERSLRLIQRGDATVVPFFMVHGGGGNVVLFRNLARNLGRKQPVYAFEWDGWSQHRGRRTIEEMAALYVEELSRFRPDGAIRLGGHCIGGLIAIEMAGLLRAQGRIVIDPLIITDSPNLAASTHKAEVPEPGSAAHDQLAAVQGALDTEVLLCPEGALEEASLSPPRRSVPHQRVVRMAARLHRLLFRTRFNRARFEQWLDDKQLLVRYALGLRIPAELRPRYCARSMVEAANRFRSRGYDGDILYFRTRTFLGSQMGVPGYWTDLYFGFNELCRGTFSCHFINAGHNEVVGHPRTAELIKQSLEIG